MLGYRKGRSTRQDEKLLCSEDILVTARNKIVPLALTLSSGPTATGRGGCCAAGWARRAPFVGKMGILSLEHSNCQWNAILSGREEDGSFHQADGKNPFWVWELGWSITLKVVMGKHCFP